MRRARISARVSAGLLLAACLGPAPLAEAAVRICRPMVVGDEEKARTEIEARRLALQRWTLFAALNGPSFASWRLAANKSISCRYLADGLHHCQARGSPCTISQVMPPLDPRLPAPDPAPAPMGGMEL